MDLIKNLFVMYVIIIPAFVGSDAYIMKGKKIQISADLFPSCSQNLLHLIFLMMTTDAAAYISHRINHIPFFY